MAALVGRVLGDRVRGSRPGQQEDFDRLHRRLATGCAGVARLRASMQDRDIPLWLNTRDLFVPVKYDQTLSPGRLYVKLERAADS